MEIPEGINARESENSRVYKLKKTLYGLSQSYKMESEIYRGS